MDDTVAWNEVKSIDSNLAEFELDEINENNIDIVIQLARIWGRAETKGIYDKLKTYNPESYLDLEILERWCNIFVSSSIGDAVEFFDMMVESLE